MEKGRSESSAGRSFFGDVPVAPREGDILDLPGAAGVLGGNGVGLSGLGGGSRRPSGPQGHQVGSGLAGPPSRPDRAVSWPVDALMRRVRAKNLL